MLMADVVRDYSASVLRPSAGFGARDLAAALAPLVALAHRELAAEGFARGRRAIDRFVDVRYVGQSFEITVPAGRDYRARFDREHRARYGYSDPSRPTEVGAVRVRAAGLTRKPVLPRAGAARAALARPAVVRPGRFGGRTHRVGFYRWDDLPPGAHGAGPAIVTGREATVVIPPRFRFRIDRYGNVVATWK
jgi:N-methylhydantoinase A